MNKPKHRPTEELSERLRERGYRITDAYINDRGRLLLVITGPGLHDFAMFQREAVALSHGRITMKQLLASRRGRVRVVRRRGLLCCLTRACTRSALGNTLPGDALSR